MTSLDALTAAGALKVIDRIWSTQLKNRRDLYVYLPPSYDRAPGRYPVVYMHDGQNLFDEALSFNGTWQVAECMAELSRIGIEALIVGIPNIGRERFQEYSPFVDPKLGGGRGEAYLRFVLETVKPLVDREFRTRPERAFTGMVGSSMGGLITLYAFFRYPDAFGFCGALSPALWFGRRAIFDHVEASARATGRLYLDVGTAEGARALDDVRRMRRLLVSKGFRPAKTLLAVEEEGARHSEAAWAARLPAALEFLVPRTRLPRWRRAWHRYGASRVRPLTGSR